MGHGVIFKGDKNSAIGAYNKLKVTNLALLVWGTYKCGLLGAIIPTVLVTEQVNYE